MIQRENKYIEVVLKFSIIITIAITPLINKDSMVIPKQILLSILCAYLVPIVVTESKKLTRILAGKIILLILVLILIQMVLVMIVSSAPLEQQFFGRSGRLLGFITYVGFYTVLLTVINFIKIPNLKYILRYFVITGFLVCMYAIAQSYNIDFFQWEKRTNSVIGTLGNPNYVSALAASISIPLIYLFYDRIKIKYLSIFLALFPIFVVYRSESIQGYIALMIGLACSIIYFTYFYMKKLLWLIFPFLVFGFSFTLAGTLGRGPLSIFLYKPSVQSRGDFWRSAISTANENPIFGVGIDSFGDYFLMHRDQVAAEHTFAEYTDSAHNYILDFAAQGGYLFAALNILILIFTIFSFFAYHRKTGEPNFVLLALFCAWFSLQSTFFISPISIPLMLWSMIFSGAIIGIYLDQINIEKILVKRSVSFTLKNLASYFLVFFTIILMFPLFNTDRLFLKSLQTNDGSLGIRVVEMFPRSSSRYTTVGRLLFESGGNQVSYSLDVAKSALNFNNNTVAAWALILVNPAASPSERLTAKNEILRLDPYNKEVQSFQIPESD